MSNEIPDPDLRRLVEEGKKTISDPERLYNLAGKRLAIRSLQLKSHFINPSNTVRVGVVGHPNTGKTTYSYSVHQVLKSYQTPSKYVDLDIYSNSGQAISGQVPWSERPKRKGLLTKEVFKSIKLFKDSHTGIIIGDFPGRINNPYQKDRLEAVDFAVILANDFNEINPWAQLISSVGKPYRYILSKPNISLNPPLHPQGIGLNRQVMFNIFTLTSATSLLEEASKISDAPKKEWEGHFSQPELMVLQEYLDLLFSIQNP